MSRPANKGDISSDQKRRNSKRRSEEANTTGVTETKDTSDERKVDKKTQFENWISRKDVEVDYFHTQFLTGHATQSTYRT